MWRNETRKSINILTFARPLQFNMNPTQNSPDESLSSFNLLTTIFKWRKQLLIVTLASVIISGIGSLLIKEKFKSTVVLFASRQNSFGEQLLEEFNKSDLLVYGLEDDSERLMQIINSDQVRNRIIDKFNLWEVYKIDKNEPAAYHRIYQEYAQNISVDLTRFGSVDITVVDESPERARDMANSIAIYTDSVSHNMRSNRAMSAFTHAKYSLEKLQSEITLLEDSMKYLQKIGVYSYESQVAYLTEQYGKAIAQGHPDRAQEIKNILEFLSKYGSTAKRLNFDIDSRYKEMSTLQKRFDLLKIDMESNLSSHLIVDQASAADSKCYPIRWLIVVVSAISTLVFGILAVLVKENIQKLKRT